MLAHLAPHEAREILEESILDKRTPFTMTDPDAILHSLADIRAKGFCLTNQEAFVGDISVSAPVFDEFNQVIAAVNIAVPWPRWTVETVEAKLAPVVVGAAQSITHGMRLK